MTRYHSFSSGEIRCVVCCVELLFHKIRERDHNDEEIGSASSSYPGHSMYTALRALGSKYDDAR